MKKLLLFLCMTVTFYGHSQTLRAMPDTFTVFQANIDTFYVTTVDSIPVGDSVCISLIDTGPRFSVMSCHAIVYHPDSLFTGRDTCRYALCDTSGLCDTTMVVIYVDTNVGLLPRASFVQDTSYCTYCGITPYCTPYFMLFNCACSPDVPSCYDYIIKNTSVNYDSIMWTTTNLGQNCWDTSLYYWTDEIDYRPYNLGCNVQEFQVVLCLTAYNKFGQQEVCDTSCLLSWCEGITEVPLSNIKIYPSPADKILTIDMSQNTNPISSNYSAINLYNSLGQRVRSIPHQGNNKLIEISVSDLPDDIYISTIIDLKGQEDVLGKFVVRR